MPRISRMELEEFDSPKRSISSLSAKTHRVAPLRANSKSEQLFKTNVDLRDKSLHINDADYKAKEWIQPVAYGIPSHHTLKNYSL